jgi:hypothetical protein
MIIINNWPFECNEAFYRNICLYLSKNVLTLSSNWGCKLFVVGVG